MRRRNSNQLAQVSTSSTGCGFANPNTGTYAGTLCFVDFTPWNTQTPTTGITCQTGQLPMSAKISNTPFTLEFCMSVTATTSGGAAVTRRPRPARPVAWPRGAGTTTSPRSRSRRTPVPRGAVEAFLGNNGFYAGVPGNPALYTVVQGSQAVVGITSIHLLGSNGDEATGWQLVTGDAESTDANSEWIIWQSDQKLSLLANSANSPIGNACGSTGQYAPPSYNNTSAGLSGLNSTTVECTNPVTTPGVNHTGTPMLQAATPSSLTVTLRGSGLQAMFLGVILP